MNPTTANYDEPWKEALTEYFSPRKRVSWRNPFSVEETRFLDFKTKKRFADKLYKVWLLSGEEVWILIHIEIQSQ